MITKTIMLSLLSYFFVDPSGNYSILMPDELKLVQIDTLNMGILNYTFVGSDTIDEIDYTLSLLVVESSGKNLTDKSVIKTYEADCTCKVTKTRLVEFRNFRGVEYSIEKQVEDIVIGGKVYISEYQNGKSINAVSMTTKEASNNLHRKLKPILDTLVLNF